MSHSSCLLLVPTRHQKPRPRRWSLIDLLTLHTKAVSLLCYRYHDYLTSVFPAHPRGVFLKIDAQKSMPLAVFSGDTDISKRHTIATTSTPQGRVPAGARLPYGIYFVNRCLYLRLHSTLDHWHTRTKIVDTSAHQAAIIRYRHFIRSSSLLSSSPSRWIRVPANLFSHRNPKQSSRVPSLPV